MKKILFFAMCLEIFLNFNCLAQPLPAMFVEDSKTRQRIYEFQNGPNPKYPILKQLIGNIDLAFIYSHEEIVELIKKIGSEDGLRMYFAVYKDCTGYSLPNNVANDKLILLFAPGALRSKPAQEKYYFIDENDNQNAVYEIPETAKACAEGWIKYFASESIQSKLRTTLISDDPENEYPSGSRHYTDTKSIFYYRESLEQATITESTYAHHLRTGESIRISDYQFSFSSSNYVGEYPRIDVPWNRRRLMVEIDYMYERDDKQKIRFSLEQLQEFDLRLPKLYKATESSKKVKIKKPPTKRKNSLTASKLDNGHLCPTNCPPDTPPK